jgi:sodium-dependent transporter
MATPIGTPPNAIALQALNNPKGLNMGIDFGEWMAFMFPLVLLLLFISWRLILKFFSFSEKTINLHILGKVHRGWRMWVVSGTFVITIFLWLIPSELTGIDANTVALIPMGIFAATGVITAKDLQSIDWSVIWMVAGGFALGLGINESGLAKLAIATIPFGSWSPIVVLIASGLICYVLSNFISNTAAALLIPILVAICNGMQERLGEIGGTSTILIGIALSASAAMCLPISTPPNAIAYSTGLVKQNDMLKIGLIVGIISMIIGYLTLFLVGEMHLLG